MLLTLTWTIIVELFRNPRSLLSVPTDDVEVRQQVERDLHEELEAEQSQDAEVNIGQLGRKRPVVELLLWV